MDRNEKIEAVEIDVGIFHFFLEGDWIPVIVPTDWYIAAWSELDWICHQHSGKAIVMETHFENGKTYAFLQRVV
jgi:hypothetical protein